MTEIIKHLVEISYSAHGLLPFDFKHLNKPIFSHDFKFKGCLFFIVYLSERMLSVLLSSLADPRKKPKLFLM